MILKTNTTPFHLVKPSPWPFVVSLFIFNTLIYITIQMHYSYSKACSIFLLSFFFFIWALFSWWYDVVIESTFGGHFTSKVRSGITLGFILFIASEVMFFFSFFWAFFHSSLSPVFNIGGIWPPMGIDIISPWGVPLLNTLILLTSGITVTKAHHALLKNQSKTVVINLDFTLILALLFTKLQLLEYTESSFIISDSVYGSLFFFNDRFPWITCYNRYFIFICLYSTLWCRSFYSILSYRFWSSYLILTFCWCSLNFIIYLFILMRWKFNYINI